MPMNHRLLVPRRAAIQGVTLYFLDSEMDGDWNTLGNWWLDAAGTIPATAIPTTTDDVVLLVSVTANTGGAISILNMHVANYASTNISLAVSGVATYDTGCIHEAGTLTGDCEWFGHNNGNNGTVNGNCVFNGTSSNYNGTINGNCVFNDSGSIFGTVNGDCTFNDTGYNFFSGTVNGNATFNDDSNNYGTVTGTVSCNTTGTCTPHP